MNTQTILDSLDAALKGICARIEKLTEDYSPTNHTLLTACLEMLKEGLEARVWVEMNETLLKILSSDPWRNAKPYEDGDIEHIPDEHDAPCKVPTRMNKNKFFQLCMDASQIAAERIVQGNADTINIPAMYCTVYDALYGVFQNRISFDAPANDGLAGKLQEFIARRRPILASLGCSASYAFSIVTKFLDDFNSSPASDVPAQLAVKKIEWKQTITDHYKGFLNGECIFMAYKMWNDRWLVFGMLETIARGMISSEERDKGFDTLGEAQQAAQTALEFFVKELIE